MTKGQQPRSKNFFSRTRNNLDSEIQNFRILIPIPKSTIFISIQKFKLLMAIPKFNILIPTLKLKIVIPTLDFNPEYGFCRDLWDPDPECRLLLTTDKKIMFLK